MTKEKKIDNEIDLTIKWENLINQQPLASFYQPQGPKGIDGANLCTIPRFGTNFFLSELVSTFHGSVSPTHFESTTRKLRGGGNWPSNNGFALKKKLARVRANPKTWKLKFVWQDISTIIWTISEQGFERGILLQETCKDAAGNDPNFPRSSMNALRRTRAIMQVVFKNDAGKFVDKW